MTLAGHKVIIAGGGVAGLSTAVALARAGAKVVVHERAAAISEVGAGLQISPNGMRALAALGLDEPLRRVAVRSSGTQLFDGLGGRSIVQITPSGTSYYVHRARLMDVLAQGAADAGVKVVTGSELSPDETDCDLLVGADGVRSALRAALNPGAEPRYTGQVAWRAVITDPEPVPVARVFLGPGRHLVSYPLHGGLRNIVACEDRRDWTQDGWSIEDCPKNLRAAFARFPDPVQAWLEQVETVHLWGLHLHPVAKRWQDGRRVLVGDAAHATLPYLAQGANLALEDAVVLARAFRGGDLAAYEAHRKHRTARVVAASAANARRFHLSNPLVRQLAFSALRIREEFRPGAASRGFSWLWDYDAATVPL